MPLLHFTVVINLHYSSHRQYRYVLSTTMSCRTCTANYDTALHPHTMCAPHAVPYTGDLHCFTHGLSLEWFHTCYSSSGKYKSSLYMSGSAEHEQYLGCSCAWLLGMARAAWLWQQCTDAVRGKKAEYMQQWYVNRLI